MIYQISKENKDIAGTITLDGSKSISNRALIIEALCHHNFTIKGLSTSKDTTTLQSLLRSTGPNATLDAGAAGTTFRFMTAFLALQSGTQTLTGSERMKQRPIGVLVDALRTLGANIEYLGREGYPPLRIHAPEYKENNVLNIPASVSSQYISALLMIAPNLKTGLELSLEGKIVSRPYIEMTLNLMAYFGVRHEWQGNTIYVAPQQYQSRQFRVEADWSAASYYYALAAIADDVDLQLNGLFEHSTQGDAVLSEMMTQFGIQTTFNTEGVHLTKKGDPVRHFEWDFIRCPDIAQTLAVVCGALGITGQFTGLETLSIKETDRVAALEKELAKVNTYFGPSTDQKDFFNIENKSHFSTPPVFATYEDHRMAMAFAPLAILGKIQIEEPMVVVKSYPAFWSDWQKIGFDIEEKSYDIVG